MLAQEIIRKKRDGKELADNEIAWFVYEMTRDNISESQVAAFAMAIFLKGMSVSERISLTESMCNSGQKLNWDLPGPIIDKHSTGGIGDCVSLLLGPALAACGGFVPMISGRGLGHTGGTLDKLDSIPGYNSQPTIELFKKTVRTVGCAIVGQTEEIAPADKRLYAIRDMTSTVESIDLITSSILSKKLSAGLDALVLDIKCGNGAFMESKKHAKILAESLVSVGNGLGCRTSALVTDMNEPLCSSVGNALEILKVVNVFKGNAKEEKLLTVVCSLGGQILADLAIADNLEQGYRQIRKTFQNGRAAEIFERMVSSLGATNSFLTKVDSELPQSPLVKDIYSLYEGYISFIDSRAIGSAVSELGGARRHSNDSIDYSVGFENLLAIGDWVDNEIPLARIHARDEQALDYGKNMICGAYRVAKQKNIKRNPTIIEKIN